MPVRSAIEFASSFPHTTEVFEQGRRRSLHFGLQIWVAQSGEVLAESALGEAIPGVPLTSNHWLPWLSAAKPLTAVLIAQLWERGLVDLDAPVATYIPEFGIHGKESILVRHLLTHTAGLRSIETGWPDVPWNETLARICAAPLDAGATPGVAAGYHVASTWFVLGEILQRIHQRPFAEILQTELLAPCGMTETRAALDDTEREQLGGRVAPLWERDKLDLKLLDWHLPPRSERPSPGSSLRGPVRDLGRFYEMLRKDGDGLDGRVLLPETVAAFRTRQRVGAFDQTLGHVVDFGLGVIIDSNCYGADTVPYGYGRYCSAGTFGHGGAQSSQGYCDPDRQLVVAYVFNGRPGEAQHSRRCRSINEAIYRDLGLAPPT